MKLGQLANMFQETENDHISKDTLYANESRVETGCQVAEADHQYSKSADPGSKKKANTYAPCAKSGVSINIQIHVYLAADASLPLMGPCQIARAKQSQRVTAKLSSTWKSSSIGL